MKQSKTLSALAVALWLAFGFSSLSLAASPSDTTAAYTVGTVSENSKAVTKEKPKKEKTSDKKKTTDKKGGAAKGRRKNPIKPAKLLQKECRRRPPSLRAAFRGRPNRPEPAAS